MELEVLYGAADPFDLKNVDSYVDVDYCRRGVLVFPTQDSSSEH